MEWQEAQSSQNYTEREKQSTDTTQPLYLL